LHPGVGIRKVSNKETAVRERDSEVEGSIRHRLEGELTQDVRLRGRPVGTLFDEHLNIGDTVQRVVSRQYLAANLDRRVVAVLLQEKVQNHAITFENQMSVRKHASSQLRNRFSP